MRGPVRSILSCLFIATALIAIPVASPACTRIVYLGDSGDVITARSMDWKLDIATNLYILPRGICRTGEAGPNSLKWTAKYGSVVATGYDVSTADGMNEKGLAAELLWLVESQYPVFGKNSRPGLTIAAWAQYVLDNFATVSEAVAALEKHHSPSSRTTSPENSVSPHCTWQCQMPPATAP
jgi:penicillin V acylase-like amidase (Ntn superfamily)